MVCGARFISFMNSSCSSFLPFLPLGFPPFFPLLASILPASLFLPATPGLSWSFPTPSFLPNFYSMYILYYKGVVYVFSFFCFCTSNVFTGKPLTKRSESYQAPGPWQATNEHRPHYWKSHFHASKRLITRSKHGQIPHSIRMAFAFC